MVAAEISSQQLHSLKIFEEEVWGLKLVKLGVRHTNRKLIIISNGLPHSYFYMVFSYFSLIPIKLCIS